MHIVKEYTNGEITVIWRADRCCHSENCWRGLPRVFNPRRKPWIVLAGADKQAVMKQIDNCPTAALTYVIH